MCKSNVRNRLLFHLCMTIMYTQTNARPVITDGICNMDGLEDLSNAIGKGTGDSSIIFRMPTKVKHGFHMVLNGTINLNDKKLIIAILPMGGTSTDGDCQIMYDFEEEMIYSSSKSEILDKQDYIFNHQFSDISNFTLRITARTSTDLKSSMLDPYFEANLAGETPLHSCEFANLENIRYVLLKQGVKNITSILFKF